MPSTSVYRSLPKLFSPALFPFWAIALSTIAWQSPDAFTGLKPAIIPLLAIIMFSMGLGLSLADFRRVLAMPGLVISGLLMQYSIMPLAALLISRLLQLDPALSVGLILLGSCPGGTASNVITWLARGNVALSITLTSLSTLLAVFLTPLLTLWLAGTSVDVPAGKMLLSILYMVILPVSVGLLLNTLLPSTIRRLQPCLPLIAVAAIVLIIAIITALNADALATLGAAVLLAVFLHNLTGLFAGYTMARLLGYPVAERRTLAIEVGMQNSGLAVALAMKHFSAAAALPGAIFSIWHNLSGSVLAYFWAKRAKKA